MLHKFSRKSLLSLTLTAAVVATAFGAAPAVRPQPPSVLCINSKCSKTPVSVAGGMKWHPGHYVWLDPNSSLASQLQSIDSLSNEPTVQGVQVFVPWDALEGAQGDYSKGFALVDQYLAELAKSKTPKRMILGVFERKFGNPKPAGTSCADATDGLLPDYISTLPQGGCALALPGAAGGLTVVARVWDQSVMDRLIALSQAYGNRYDSNPLMEMFIGNDETSIAAPPSSDYSDGAYISQLKRWFDASRGAWPHTQLRLEINWLGNDSQAADLIKYVSGYGIVGGPDPELPVPNVTRTIQGNQVFRAIRGGGQDQRNVMPWIGEVQEFGLGVKFTQEPSYLADYNSNVMHGSYMVWLMNGWLGGPDQRWSTGILPYIRSINGRIANTACPPVYTQGCNTN